MITSPSTVQARGLADIMRLDGYYMAANTVDALATHRDMLVAALQQYLDADTFQPNESALHAARSAAQAAIAYGDIK